MLVHNGTEIYLQAMRYRNNDTVALLAYTVEDDEDYADITVNLEQSAFADQQDYQFVDTNNLPGIDKWLEENGLAEPTGITGSSGFCSYPLMKFNRKRLEEEVGGTI